MMQNKPSIERSASDLHRDIWLGRASIWRGQKVPAPIDMLQPEIAGLVIGVDYQIVEELGKFGFRGDCFETAGMLDRNMNRIAVSRRFNKATMRFTGSHEIGHWIMHSAEIMHRDRPIVGLASSRRPRSVQEQEADYFAACFLMPEKLVVRAFELAFETKIPISFSHDVAFHLDPRNYVSLLRAPSNSGEREAAFAAAESYRGKFFNSLASQFGVSVPSMAIRIKELGLVRE